MGALYLARDPSLDRLVAIKLLKEDFQDDPELRERFIREARSVARLRHPNIVVVHDVGEDDGRPFMAMEYIAGETLNHALRRTPSLPLVRRLALVEDLCAGLAHAHSAGIIHRDIKPANIMLDGEGVLKVLDFGIARLGNSGMTQEGMMMGTVNYMSPEQVAGRNVDHRTDIFAVGAVLYEVIALEQAFPGRIDTGVLQRLLHEGPVPLDKRVPGVDRELAGIVRKALDMDPARRYQDANVMRYDLSRVRRRLTEEGESEAAAARDTTLLDHPKSSKPAAGPKVESDRGRRLSPERVAELRRQQVEEYLRFGEEAFARGDHDAALQYAERAATVDPDSRAAIELLDKARLAIESKAIRQLLAEAQRLLSDGHIEDAAALADEASVTLPDIHGAAELRREVRATVDKIAAIRQREQRIAASLDRARSSLGQGGYETALRAVYEVLALDPERSEARALEHEAKSRLQAQREHERARRNAYDEISRGRTLADAGKYDEAADVLSGVTGPSDTVRMAAAEALASMRNAQREAAQAVVVASAQEAFAQGRFEEAQAALDTIPADERTPAAKALRIEVENALREQRQRERKRQALEAAIGTIQKLIRENSPAKALERLEEAAAIGLEDERLALLRQEIANIVAAAEEKRRQEARDRVAAKRVEAARQLLANGDGYAAIALLERDGSGHPLVAQTLRDIRVAVAEHEERSRKEAERRRQEEEARKRAEIEAARKLEEQHKAEEQRRRLEEERRRREAEHQRRREEVATLLGEAERALSEQRPKDATLLLKRVDDQMMSVKDADLQRRIAAVKIEVDRQEQKEREEIQRREEEARQREDALTRILTRVSSTPEHTVALDLLNDALTLAPTDRRVQTLVQERQGALERQRVEDERRQQEARRREGERRAQEEEARRRAEAEAARLREEQRKAAEQQRQEEEERQRRQEVVRLLTDGERVVSERPDEAAGLLSRAESIRLARRDADLTGRSTALRVEIARQKEEALKREREARRREEELRRQEEEARRRAIALDELLTKARGERAHDAALTLLQQAQTLAPDDARVETLIVQRRSALEAQRDEQRRQEEQRRREEDAAAKVVARAHQRFEEGHHEEARTLLRQSPPHVLTRNAIADLEARYAELERRRRQEALRRQRAERRAAALAAITHAARDRRLHTAIGVVVVIALVTSVWRSWDFAPQPPQTPSPTISSEANPPAGPPSTIESAPPVSNSAQPTPSPQPDSQVTPGARGRSTSPQLPPPANSTRSTESAQPTPPRSTEPTQPPPPRPTDLTPPAPRSPPDGAPAVPTTTTPRPSREETPSPVPAPPAPAPPQTTVTTPQPEAPRPTTPRVDLEEAEIERLLNEYVAAYSRMDEARLRQIDPSFAGIRNRELIRSVQLSLPTRRINVSPDGQSATVSATGSFSYTWNRAGFPATNPAQLNWRLQKVGTNWTVIR
jgi:hypothetical protein